MPEAKETHDPEAGNQDPRGQRPTLSMRISSWINNPKHLAQNKEKLQQIPHS